MMVLPDDQLTPEELELRRQGRALVAKTIAFAREHPEFLAALEQAERNIDEGRYWTFPEEGEAGQ